MMRRLILFAAIAALGLCFAEPINSMLAADGTNLLVDEGIVSVEYLESTGTQYIDTGVFWDDSTHTYSWDVVAQAVYDGTRNYHWFCGWFWNGKVMSCGAFEDPLTQYVYYPIGEYFQNGISIGNGKTTGEKYEIVEHIFSLMNESIPYSLKLFIRTGSNGNINSSASLRIYSFKSYDNGELVIDLIPVRIGNDGFMLDTVSGNLFRNAGTGAFIIGPDL